MTSRVNVRAVASLVVVFAAACGKDGNSGPVEIGPPASITVNNGPLSAPANTELTTATVVVKDANGAPVPNQLVTFSVTGGSGTLTGGTSATSDANGNVTIPPWKLGKTNVPQVLHATAGSFATDITATVATSYRLVVRFYGPTMTAAQQAVFTNAAARIEGMVTGDLPNFPAQQNLVLDDGDPNTGDCAPGQPNFNEAIDDMIIFVSVRPIDGVGNVVGSAGPCYYRLGTSQDLPLVGQMIFDSADFNTFLNNGQAELIATHEMLHTLSFGLWVTPYIDPSVESGFDTNDPRFLGPQARQACADLGGTECASTVPVEGLPAPEGSRNSHWREASFAKELMTPCLNSGVNPLSLITARSLQDLKYVINAADVDDYTVTPGAACNYGPAIAGAGALVSTLGWERAPTHPVYAVDGKGTKIRIRVRQ